MAVFLTSAYANWGLAEAAVASGDILQLDSAIALAANGSLPSGVTLQFMGGSINPGAFTMTISGRIWAPPDVAIFTATTDVRLSKRDQYWASWFNGADIAAKWNNMIACYARVSNRNRSGYTFRIAPGEYACTVGMDITGIRGTNRINTEGAQLTFTTAGLVCVDMTGSTGIEVTSFNIIGGAGGTRPAVGLLLARDNRDSLTSAGKHRFYDLSIDGEFSTAALYCVSAEETHFTDPQFGNTHTGLFILYFGDKNVWAVQSQFDGQHAGTKCLPGNGDAYLDVTTSGSTATSIQLLTGGISGSVVGRKVYVNGESGVVSSNDADTIVLNNPLPSGSPAAGVPVQIHSASDASCSGLVMTSLRADGQADAALYCQGFDRMYCPGAYIASSGTHITLDAEGKSIIGCKFEEAYCHADEGSTPEHTVVLKGGLNTALNGCVITLRKTASDGDPGDPHSAIDVESPLGNMYNCRFDTLGGHFTAHEDLSMHGCTIRSLLHIDDPDDEGVITLGEFFSGDIFLSFEQNLVQAADHVGSVFASQTSGDWPKRVDSEKID